MDRSCARAAVAFVLMAIACATSTSVTAQEPPAAPLTGLEVKIDVDFDAVEFVDVVAALNDRYGAHVQVDLRRLTDAGILLTLPVERIVEDLQRRHHLPDGQLESLRDVLESGAAHPITFAASGITLRSALRHIVLQVSEKLAVREVDGAAIITTDDAAKQALITRVYDVRNILPPPRAAAPPQWADATELERAVEQRDPRELALRDLIVATIAPETWDDIGGPGAADYRDGVLVVLQTPDVQRQVAGLVTTLQEVQSPAAPGVPSPTSIPISDWPAGKPAEARIRATLDRPTDFSRTQVSLADLAAALQQEFGLPVLLSGDARRLSRRQPPVLVSLEGQGRPLRTALHLALAPLRLAATVQDEVLVLTDADDAASRLRLVVYPVADVARNVGDSGRTVRLEELTQQVIGTIAPESWGALGGSGAILPYEAVPALAVWQTDEVHRRIEGLLVNLRQIREARPPAVDRQEGPAEAVEEPLVLVVFRLWQPWHEGAQISEERLAEEIKTLVEPAAWEAEDTFIRVLPSRLIIRQRPEVHREIYRLLRDLGVLRPQGNDGDAADLESFHGLGGGGLGGGFGAGGFGSLPSGGP
jgi:hypothetical protein